MRVTLEQLRKSLESAYPQMRHSEMDDGSLWLSLTPIDNHEIVEYKGAKYRVLYSWEWTTYGNDDIGYIPIYAAEVEPEGAQ